MKNALFSLEGIDALLPGTTKGNKWNGWACPYFDYNQARGVMQTWNAALTNGEGRMRYDAERDAFVCVVEGEEEVFGATEVYGIKMYGIGNGSWCWDETQLKYRWHVDVENYYGDYAYLYLPEHMNRRDLTVAMLKDLKILKHPDVLKGLLIAMAKKEPGNTERKVAEMRALFRRLPCRSPAQVRQLFQCCKYSEKDLRNFIDRLIDNNGLYDAPEGVKAKKAASFSYKPDDDDGYNQSMHKNVECPQCDHKETVYCEGSEHIETIANWMNDFEHLTGPYVRCKDCGNAIRPTISDAAWSDVEPDTEGDPDLWDNHKEYMEELVKRLQEHAVDKGLPKPTHLMLTASGIDWRNRTGWRRINADGEELAEAMTVNSQFMLDKGCLWLEPDGTGELSVVMYHHDAPTGGIITARPAWRCDIADMNRYSDDEDFIVGDDVFKAKVYGKIAETLLCGDGEAFPYTKGSTFDLACHSQIYEALREQQKAVPELDDKPATLLECYQEMLNQQYDEMIELLNSGDGMAAYEAALSVRTYLDLYLPELEKGEPEVVLIMEGGLLAVSYTNVEDLKLLVIDEDTEGGDEVNIYNFKNIGECYVTDITPRMAPGVVDDYRKAKDAALPAFAGTVIHRTLRSQDLLPTFWELYQKRGNEWDVASFRDRLTAEGYELAVGDDEHPYWDDANETVNDLIDRLNATAPEGFYFGAHPGDGSDFGFWQNEEE